MKVWELIAKLENLPASMEVLISGERNDGDPFPISQVSFEDPAEPLMTVLLIFEDRDISYHGDQMVVDMPQKRGPGRPRKQA